MSWSGACWEVLGGQAHGRARVQKVAVGLARDVTSDGTLQSACPDSGKSCVSHLPSPEPSTMA